MDEHAGRHVIHWVEEVRCSSDHCSYELVMVDRTSKPVSRGTGSYRDVLADRMSKDVVGGHDGTNGVGIECVVADILDDRVGH